VKRNRGRMQMGCQTSPQCLEKFWLGKSWDLSVSK
jgi:hypothetical protein